MYRKSYSQSKSPVFFGPPCRLFWYFCAVWRVAGVFFSHLLGDFADSGDPLIQTRAVVPGIGHARSFGVARSVCDAAVLVLHV